MIIAIKKKKHSWFKQFGKPSHKTALTGDIQEQELWLPLWFLVGAVVLHQPLPHLLIFPFYLLCTVLFNPHSDVLSNLGLTPLLPHSDNSFHIFASALQQTAELVSFASVTKTPLLPPLLWLRLSLGVSFPTAFHLPWYWVHFQTCLALLRTSQLFLSQNQWLFWVSASW